MAENKKDVNLSVAARWRPIPAAERLPLVPAAERLPLVPAATVVLMRSAAAGAEVLMVRRNASASRFGGTYVFPGGLLDPVDSAPRTLQRVIGITESDAQARLRSEAGALPHWVAAIRECYEEAGILLALDERGQPIDPERVARLAHKRDALNAGALGFADFLEEEGLLLPADAIAYFSHWITPPIHKRRFDTRFFLACAPEGQQSLHDNAEMVECVWLTAKEVLARYERSEMEVAFPTRQVLLGLGRFASPEEALADARAIEEIVPHRPCYAQGREGSRMFRPGDAPYAEIHWVDPEESGTSSYDMIAGVPKRLDRYVTRIIAPNPGVMTGPGTNTYLVGEKELAVIDPGPLEPSHIEAILAAGGGRIKWILSTHTHRDHSPAAAALKRATGAAIAGRPAPAVPNHDTGFTPDRVLADGEALRFDGIVLRAVHTPGHASNHLCYLLEQTRMLFTGDHIMQGSTVVIYPPDGNMQAYLDSLQRLLGLELSILAPGHGYLISRPHAEVRRLVRHRLARESKVRRALAEAGGSAALETLLPRVYDDVPVALHPMAARSLQAHLEKLIADGELAVSGTRYVQRVQR